LKILSSNNNKIDTVGITPAECALGFRVAMLMGKLGSKRRRV
jgi:hypothetical protein